MKKVYLAFIQSFVLLIFAIAIAPAQDDNIIANGGFEDDFAWTVYDMSGNATASATFGVVDTALAPAFGDGPFLELTGESTYSNILVWQDLTLIGGQTYEFNGAFRDLTDEGVSNFWCEIYISPEAPVDGEDWKPPAGDNSDRITGFNTWDGCGPHADGTFEVDGCEPPATKYYTAPGNPGEDVVIYFGVKTGVWSDGDPLFFDVAVDEFKLFVPATDVDSKNEIPQTLALLQNYPNPFNPSTTIQFSIEKPGKVALTIFDIQGRKMATLISQAMAAGAHQVQWSGQDDIGEPAPSGLYFVRLQTESAQLTKKISLIR